MAVPQSNQRGIETTAIADFSDAVAEPQSNQRGIETMDTTVIGGTMKVPQSNQRGIETRKLAKIRPGPMSGLNRTSVGLKHHAFKIEDPLDN